MTAPTCRPMRDFELGDVIALLNEAFFPSVEESRLVEALMWSDGYLPEYNIVAEKAGRIVGHILLTRVFAVDGTALLLVAPLAVALDAQRSGIGTALVEYALAYAREHGETAVFVYGDPAYYGRFGFTAQATAGVVPPTAFFEPGWQAVALQGETHNATAGPLRVPAALAPEELWLVPEG